MKKKIKSVMNKQFEDWKEPKLRTLETHLDWGKKNLKQKSSYRKAT